MKYLLCTIMNYSLIFATAQVGVGGGEKKDFAETQETKGRGARSCVSAKSFFSPPPTPTCAVAKINE